MVRNMGHNTAPWVGYGQEYGSEHCPGVWMWSGVQVRTLSHGLDMVRSMGQDIAPGFGCGQEYRSGHCPMGWIWSGVWVRTLPRGLDVVRSMGQDTAPWVGCGQEYKSGHLPMVGCGQEYGSGHCPMGWMWSGVQVRTLPCRLDVVRSMGQDTAPWARCGQDTDPWVGCSQEYRSGHCPMGWMWSGVQVRTLPHGLDVVRSTG